MPDGLSRSRASRGALGGIPGREPLPDALPGRQCDRDGQCVRPGPPAAGASIGGSGVMKVAGKTLVVTGAGSGIGRAVTLEAVRRGARVAAVDLNPATLAETAHQVVAPQMLSAHELDLTDRAAVEALPGAVVERWAA